jgi:uncharacterized protein (DUF1697 family)
MVAYVGLLRAVNVSGSGGVRMDALREALTRMGLDEVSTLLQSGNVIFNSAERNAAALEGRIEQTLLETFSLSTTVFLRTGVEWGSILRANPFRREAEDAPAQLVLTALKQGPGPDAWKALGGAIRGPERVRGSGRHAYIFYPDGIGRSRLTPSLIEKHLGTRGTSRNWNTVTKLAEAAGALP